MRELAPDPANSVRAPVAEALQILLLLSAMYIGQASGLNAIAFGYVSPAELGMKTVPPALTFRIVLL